MSDPRKPAPSAPLWRQAFDAAERAVAPRAEGLVRTEYFALATAVARRAQMFVGRSAQGVTARAWHLVNLPAGSDINRLRTQIGSLDREVRRLTLQLESARRQAPAPNRPTQTTTEDSDADGTQPEDGARPSAPRRRAQRAAGP